MKHWEPGGFRFGRRKQNSKCPQAPENTWVGKGEEGWWQNGDKECTLAVRSANSQNSLPQEQVINKSNTAHLLGSHWINYSTLTPWYIVCPLKVQIKSYINGLGWISTRYYSLRKARYFAFKASMTCSYCIKQWQTTLHLCTWILRYMYMCPYESACMEQNTEGNIPGC